MTSRLEKYAGDICVYDFDCTNLLAADEQIDADVEIVMSALPFQGEVEPPTDFDLVFGTPVVNADPITYPDGRVMAAGKGFQVRISKGEPAAQDRERLYSVEGVFSTTLGNTLTTRAPLALLPPAFIAL